jgi:predicted P-loop ATPase/GTPase
MWRIREFFVGFRNFWYFRKEIWNFRGWDYTFQLRLWRKSLIPLRDSILNGYEVRDTRLMKVEAIQEAIDLMDRIIDDVYMDIAEAELGIEFSDNNSATEAMKVINRSNELAERDWKRLWRIFQGQNHNEYVMLLDRVSDPNQDIWAQWFDGTGMKGWWD